MQDHGYWRRHDWCGPVPSDRIAWGRHWGTAVIRRSQGDSFVGLASFITGVSIMNERTGTRCEPNHPAKLPGYIVAVPKEARAEFTDRRQLSNTVNDIERSEMLVNRRVGRYWVVDATSQHSGFDHFAAVAQIANKIARRYRVFVVASIGKTGDHTMQYHFGCNLRRIDAKGFGRKVKQIKGMTLWPQEPAWFSRTVRDAIIRQQGIITWEQEEYEYQKPVTTSYGMKSIRRRGFRNSARAFASALKLKGVEPYLREAFPDQEAVSVAYNLINWTCTKEEFKSMRGMGLRDRAEIFA